MRWIWLAPGTTPSRAIRAISLIMPALRARSPRRSTRASSTLKTSERKEAAPRKQCKNRDRIVVAALAVQLLVGHGLDAVPGEGDRECPVFRRTDPP